MQSKECCKARKARSEGNVNRARRGKAEVDENKHSICWKLSISLPKVFVYFLYSAKHGVISGGVPEGLLQAR